MVKSGRRQAGPSAIYLAAPHRTAHHPHAKGLDTIGTGSFEELAIRPHTLGKFRALLGTTARHPAMVFYLDNWQNSAPYDVDSKGKFEGINENYARELMELHTHS